MEERGNKTIMSGVLFLDIVEYSKKSVAGQISLKDRFNNYLSAAIRDVLVSDRIILDTGDGAAINFLGDIEDALKAAFSLRESISGEDPNVDPPLQVRIGINLGPVRLVRDINGQPNIVGDGINVAQRVMGFADINQILVSRSYYEAVSRLSPEYAGMFHFQGSRTDKHVREHEVYAVGHAGDKTTERAAANILAEEEAKTPGHILAPVKIAWNHAASRLDGSIESIVVRFRAADSKQRAVYTGAIAVLAALLIASAIKLAHHNEIPVAPVGADAQTADAARPASSGQSDKTKGAISTHSSAASKASANKHNPQNVADGKNDNGKLKIKPPKAKLQDEAGKKAAGASGGNADAYISVSCMEGTEVFVDGARKGRVIGSWPLILKASSGKHTVTVSHPNSGIITQTVELRAGKTELIKPGSCN